MEARSHRGVGTGPFVCGMPAPAIPYAHAIGTYGFRSMSVSFSPDGSTLASGSWDGTVRLWDARTGNSYTTRCRDIRSVCLIASSFSPDGTTCSHRGVRTTPSVCGMPAPGNPIRYAIGTYGSLVLSVSFSPDGNMLASGSSGRDHPSMECPDRKSHPHPIGTYGFGL